MFKKIISAISGFFAKEVPIVEHAFTSSVGLVNVLKTFLGSATGQTVEAIIELVLPGASTAIFTALNTFFKDFGILQGVLTGTPAQITAQGLNAIANLQGDSKTLALSNVTSIIANAGSNANGGASTIQQAIVSVPIVYNPNILNATVPVETGANLAEDPAA